MGKRGNGEGGITRHKKSGLYMARYTVETPTGKKRKTVYGKTREEAHEKLIEALSNRNKGLIFEGENQTLSAYLDRWLNGSVKGSVKPSTYRELRANDPKPHEAGVGPQEAQGAGAGSRAILIPVQARRRLCSRYCPSDARHLA